MWDNKIDFKEHTDKEHADVIGIQNCLNLMAEIILSVPADRQYTIDVKSSYYNWYKYYTGEYDMRDYAADDYPTEDNWELPCDHCQHNYDCMNCTEKFY